MKFFAQKTSLLNRPSFGNGVPFRSSIAALWRMDQLGSMVLSGGNVTSVRDLSGNAGDLTTSGTLAYQSNSTDSTGLGGFVNFSDGASYFTMPSLVVNRRSSSVFIWHRKNNNTQINYNSLFIMPSTSSGYALMFSNNRVQQFFDNTSGTETGFGVCHDMICSYMIGGPSNFYAGLGSSLYTKGSALTAGTVTGGRIGLWTAASFPLYGSIKCVLIYNQPLSLADRMQVLRWGEGQFNAVPVTCNTFHECAGDSRTFGTQSTNTDNYSWPSQYARLHGLPPKLYQDGSPGDTIQSNTAQTKQIARLNNNSGYTNRVCWMAYGINDVSGGRTDVQVEADLASAITNVRAGSSGCKVIIPTIPSKGGLSGTQQTYLANINTWIKNTAACDAVVDWAAALPDPTNTTYFDADQLHMTNAGYAVMASAAKSVTDSRGWTP